MNKHQKRDKKFLDIPLTVFKQWELAYYQKLIDPDKLFEYVAEYGKVSVDALRRRAKIRELNDLRAIIIFVLRKNGYGSVEVGRIMNRVHGSILRSYNRCFNEYEFELQAKLSRFLHGLKILFLLKDEYIKKYYCKDK